MSAILRALKSLANPENVAGMARYGISSKGTLGVSIPVLRKMAKEIGTNHKLAQELWKSGIHEARLLAGFVDDPELVTEKQCVAGAQERQSSKKIKPRMNTNSHEFVCIRGCCPHHNLDVFVREQDLIRRLVGESILPSLEVDVSNSDVPQACGVIADWLEQTGGLWAIS